METRRVYNRGLKGYLAERKGVVDLGARNEYSKPKLKKEV